MKMLGNLSIYWGMLHIIFLFIILLRPRTANRKVLIEAGIGMGLLMLVNGAGLALYGIEVLSKAFLFTCFIPGVLLFYGGSADRKLPGLFLFVSANTVCLWIMAAADLLGAALCCGQAAPVFRLLAFPLAELLAWRSLKKPCQELEAAVEQGWAAFTGLAVLHYVLLAVAMQYISNLAGHPKMQPFCVLVLFLVPFSYAAGFFLLYRQLILSRRLQRERVLLEQERLLRIRLEQWKYVQAMTHERKRRIAVLSELVLAGKLPEADAYLKGVKEELDAAPERFCANKRLNVVFDYYAQRFQELGTPLMLDLRIGGEKLPELELCQILSNGLENAWAASAGLSEGEAGVSVKMKYSGDDLVIRIKNRCRKDLFVEKGTMPVSRKKSGHGFGLLTIRAAAEGLGGRMCCYTDHGYFVLEVNVPWNA